MRASPRALRQFTSAEGMIGRYGDMVWFALCDNIPIGQPFRLKTAEDIVMRDIPLARKTIHSILRGVLITVQDEGIETGDPMVERVSGVCWRLV